MSQTAHVIHVAPVQSALSFSNVAVLIPCYNEEATIAKVINDFRQALPGSQIFVFDNNSTDETLEIARQAGAVTRSVSYQGKGSVVRRMFADIEASVYVMVDGDDTYEASQAPEMIQALTTNGLDMVVGMRKTVDEDAYRMGHKFGNVLLTTCVATIFGQTFKDMLSGYRVFSRRYVKSFPAHSMGFETETELTVHALQLKMPVMEVRSPYRARPEGSVSKLNTYRDGIRILLMIFLLFKAEKPFAAFASAAAFCTFLSIVLALPLLDTYLNTGLVPRMPTAVLCAAIMLFGAILLACGLILDTVTRGRIEAKRMAYLRTPSPTTRDLIMPCSDAS